MNGMTWGKIVKMMDCPRTLNRIRKKLRERRGESLSETLLALLISALALAMLAGAISSAANVITRGKEQMELYYAADAYIARHDGESVEDVNKSITGVTVTINEELAEGSGALSKEYSTTCYENDAFGAKPVISYGE